MPIKSWTLSPEEITYRFLMAEDFRAKVHAVDIPSVAIENVVCTAPDASAITSAGQNDAIGKSFTDTKINQISGQKYLTTLRY